MKVLSWSLFLLFAAITVLFAIANRQGAVISLDPLPFNLQAPLYLVVLAAAFGGFLIAAAGASVSIARARSRLREAQSRIARIEAENARLRAGAAPAVAESTKDRPTLKAPTATPERP